MGQVLPVTIKLRWGLGAVSRAQENHMTSFATMLQAIARKATGLSPAAAAAPQPSASMAPPAPP